MEDNIYDELDNYERVAEYDELKEDNNRLQQCVRELNEKISQLTQDNSKLTERLDNIEKNFATLLNTAKAEIERKTEMIATLNMEKDQLIFRHIGNRNNRPDRWNFDRNPQNSKPNKRKLDRPPSEENKIPRLEAQRDVRDTEVQISNRTEERVEDENRKPTAIRRNDEFKKRRKSSVIAQSPHFSSDDEILNPHYNNQTPMPNSPECIEPEPMEPKEEDQNPIQHVHNIVSARIMDKRKNSEEFRRSKKDYDKYDNNFESSVKSRCLENRDLRHQIRSSERYEDDYRSRRKPSRELDDRYGNTRFDRGSRGRRFSRSKYRDEIKPRYSKSRTRMEQEKFNKYRRSRSQSPGYGLGSRDGRMLSRHSREMTGYSMTSREFQKRSISPNRVRQRSLEKHWNDDREPRQKTYYERSHSNSREDPDGLNLRRKTEYACEPTQLEDTKLELNKEEAYSQTFNQKNDVDIHRKLEHVTNPSHRIQTDHKKYNNEQAHEPKLPMWQANRALWELNKGRCRSNSFSQLDRQSSRDHSANSRVCQSPDEMDGGYTPAPIEPLVLIPCKGPLTVYDDPRLYHERYFHNEEIGKHKASRFYNAKELDTLNLLNRRHVNWKLTRFEYTQQQTEQQYLTLPQETTKLHNTLRTQETRQEKFCRDLQHQLQQHQQQEQQYHKETQLSDEDITQNYANISGRCSQASLESGEIEDSLSITEKVEKTNGKLEPHSSTEIKICMDAINPDTLEPTVKKENVRHTAKLPSINDRILPFKNKSKGYKIPKIKKSKDSSKTRTISENKNSDISLKHNMTNKLDVNNTNEFGNCALEKGMPLETSADKIQVCHNEEELNTKPEDKISNLINYMKRNVEELLENGKNVNKLEVKLKIKESSGKEVYESTECHKKKDYVDKCKPNKHKEKEKSKDYSKKPSKEQNIKPVSMSQPQSDVNKEVVNFRDCDVKKTKDSQSVDSSTEKTSLSNVHSIKLINDITDSKMDVDPEDMKLSDLRKQKELDNGDSEHLEHKEAKHSKREHSRSRRKSKTGSVLNVNTNQPVLFNDAVVSPVHLPTISKSSIKSKDSKQINMATEQIRVSEKHLEMVKAESKVESKKKNTKKEIKIERNQSTSTSKIEDFLKGAQIEQNIKNKAKNETNPEKIIELFGETSLLTPEDLQVPTVQSDPSADIHPELEFELNELFDEHVKTPPSILCKINKSKITSDLRKSEPFKTINTMAKESTQKMFTKSRLNETLSRDNKMEINETNKKEATSFSPEYVEKNLPRLADIKAEEGSKNNQIQRNKCIPFVKPSIEIQQQEKCTLDTESITMEHLVKHNHNKPKPQDSPPAENSHNKVASNVNEISRDMPSITDNEKYRQSDCIHSDNLENVPVCTNIHVKLANKNSDSEPHTDSDCERPLFMTSTPNPKVSPQPYQKIVCVHSPIKEITTPEVSEQTNCVTVLNDSLQSTSSVQANVSQSQASLAPVGAPTQQLFIRRKRRVIVREP